MGHWGRESRLTVALLPILLDTKTEFVAGDSLTFALIEKGVLLLRFKGCYVSVVGEWHGATPA